MKNLFAALALVLGSSSALAASADFTRLNLQPGGYLQQNRVTSGQIIVDTENKALTIVAQPAFYCPPGKFCAQVMPPALLLSVPLKSISTGPCGETIYSGSQDERPVDGLFQSIVVIDNKNLFCQTLVAVPPTTVTYRAETPFGGVETDSFIASPLK